MKYSIYQIALFDATTEGTDSLIIEAVAGSGKTTSIVEACNRLDPRLSVLFLAFNKSIVNELVNRLPKRIVCKTFNACGWGAWRSYTGKRSLQIDAQKTRKIIRNRFEQIDQNIYGAFVAKMVALAKSMGLNPNSSLEEWSDLQEHHNVSIDSDEPNYIRAFDLCAKTLQESINQAGVVCDFDDQIYMPWLENAGFEKFDVVFIDEAQDTNNIQKELLARMLKPGGRLIAVGDPNQAIYGFRGADSDSMPQLQAAFNARSLPLSISYRCAKAVVSEAQKYVSHIQAFENAPEGSVSSMPKYDVSDFGENDAILCRNNAPLISMAYSLISRGRGINFLGRDMGKGLKSLINQMNAKDVIDLTAKLEQWRAKETARLLAKDQEEKVELIQDRINCIEIFVSNLTPGHDSIPDLIAAIDDLFGEKGRGITLSSVHKSKGMEWEKVFILDFHLMPSKYAKKDWMRVQENNLIYVAITRAKLHLRYITSDCWKDSQDSPTVSVASSVASETSVSVKATRSKMVSNFNPLL